MDFLNIKLLPANLVEAIGSTLIHSLWQGVILAVVTGLIIVCTRKSSPAMRYNLLIGALLFFIAGVAVTFFVVFNPLVVDNTIAHQQTIVSVQQMVIQNQIPYQQVTQQQPAFKEVAMGIINKNANSIVLIWFIIVFARSLQLASGLNGLYYLRNKSIFAIDVQWQNRVAELASKLGISQVVNIAQSGIAKAPMVIGHLKPLILIPVGLIAALTTEEVEAIIIHELAHVRRRDYLINLLQSFAEILFFFNPAVLWISALIKSERENCCDDIVIAQNSSKSDYIKALVSCQEYRSTTSAYAMALSGHKNQLLSRVKRMLSNNNQSLNMMEKSILALCLVSACLLSAAFTNADKINTLVTKTAKAVEHIAVSIGKKETNADLPEARVSTDKNLTDNTDTSKKGTFKIYHRNEVKEHESVSVKNGRFTSQLYKQDGILYQLNYKDNVLSSMQVNSKKIPNGHIANYQSIIELIQSKNNMVTAKPSEAIDMTGANQTVSSAEIQKMLADIIKEKEAAMKKNSDQFEAFVAYGDDYRKNGQYQDAVDSYKKAETINPLNPSLEKKIADTKRILEATLSPEEKQKRAKENATADETAKNLEKVNALIAEGDYYRSKHRYQDALDVYKKAEPISPAYLDLSRIISYTQQELNQQVADSVNSAYGNGSYSGKTGVYSSKSSPKLPRTAYAPKKGAVPPYTTNYAYTAAGKGERARTDSIARENIMNDMQKDGIITTRDGLSFKIGTKEFVVNGKKQPDDIYQKYRARYVKVVGHGDWEWYYNFDTSKSVTDETNNDK